MKSIISLTLCVTAALLSTASPLGDRRVLSRKHTGAPLARRFILSSRFDAPAACAAKSDSGNATTVPASLNVTDTATPDAPDNSTVSATIAGDNSTVSDTPADANATAPADNSTATANSTVTRRYGSWNFDDTWFDLCVNSGGNLFDNSDPCFDYGIDGFSALFADADVCAQQDIADAMITFAKSEGIRNSADLIQAAVAYRKLSRESVEIFGFYPSTPYCGKRAINTELSGIWNEQPEGVTIGLYGGPNYPIVPFGADGSCPYGQFPDVTSCSCVSNFFGSSAGVSAAPTATETSDDSTVAATPTDAIESATASDAVSTDAASTTDDSDSSTDAADAASSTDAVDAASSTDAADAASSTDAAAAAAATPDSPDGISGNINDPNGRR
ncbi:hypothetical protein B0H14DRAFT_2661180 [Mycena olivaceomarginata]|nr:hypothetical protein B0H14DRAFT_2661180 [Mycena olivaceomarginata]